MYSVSPLQKESSSTYDLEMVDWDGPSDPQNPKNWSFRRKLSNTVVISLYEFMSSTASSMVAPALSELAIDLHITSSVKQQIVLSVYLLGYAVGPMLFSSLSELYGRRKFLLWSNILHLLFNLACGLARSDAEMIAFRLLSGMAGSASFAIGGACQSDVFSKEERGKSLSIYYLVPLLGPVLAPLAGSYIVTSTSWRWIFYTISIADAAVSLLGFIVIRETYAPWLLNLKKEAVARKTSNLNLHTRNQDTSQTLTEISNALIRPFKLLTTQPIIQLLALYVAFLYGSLYLVISTYIELWRTQYHQSLRTSGLNFLSLGFGFILGSQLGGRLQDLIFRKLAARKHHISAKPTDAETQELPPVAGTAVAPADLSLPEYHLPLTAFGSILIPAGIFLYGWSADRTLHPIFPNIGIAIYTLGYITSYQCILAYTIHNYPRYAASAIAATTLPRYVAAFAFPLFAPTLYARLGYGLGNSVVGCVAVVIGWPVAGILWWCGARLRARSQFATEE